MVKVVEIEIRSVSEDRVATGLVKIERRRGATWIVERSFAIASGGKGSRRRLLLNENERAVVEGDEVVVEEYDKEQNLVRIVGGKAESVKGESDEDGDV